MSNKKKFIAIMLAIATALTMVGCPDNPPDDNGDENGPIIDTPTVIENGGIEFTIPAGLIREGQLAAIEALINNLNVSEFADFVAAVNFASAHTWTSELVGGGDDIKAIITLPVIGLSAEMIATALAETEIFVNDEREAAREAAANNAIVQTPTNIDNAGINFHIAGGLLTQGEVTAITNMVNGLNVAAFTNYINSVEFAKNVPGGLEIEVGTGEDATADITIESTAAANAIMAALNLAKAAVESARDIDVGPVINFVTERAHATNPDMVIKFYAEEGISNEEITAIFNITNAVINTMASNVSRATQMLEVEGGRIIEIGDDGRAILYRDGTAGTWTQDLNAARLAAQAAQQVGPR